MNIRDLFSSAGAEETLKRIENLSKDSQPLWGKMTVGQMMAHCSVAYDMALTDKYPKAGAFKTFLISLLAKKAVVGPKPYPRNGRTAPDFVITGPRDFMEEKARLVSNIKKALDLGAEHFDGKQSTSFGKLSKKQWNTLFSKHLDHHLTQFGV